MTRNRPCRCRVSILALAIALAAGPTPAAAQSFQGTAIRPRSARSINQSVTGSDHLT